MLVCRRSFHCAQQRRRQAGASCKFSHSDHAVSGCYRHNAGNYRHFDAGQFTAVAEVIKILVVKEELGDDVVGAGIDFSFQVFNLLQPVRRFWMAFRKTGNADAHVGEIFLDKCHQIRCILESAFGHFPLGLTLGRITAKGKDILDIVFIVFFQNRADFVPGGSDAGEVRDNGQVCFFADPDYQVVGVVPGSAACAVGDTYIRRPQGHHMGDVLKEFLPVCVCFRREEFKAERDFG